MERHWGLWLLPLFLLTGLIGATLAGGLAVLYYSQQVAELREQTAGARARLDEAVDEVDAAVAGGVDEIDERVATARELTRTEAPIDSLVDVGVFAVAVSHADGSVAVGSSVAVVSDAEETALVTASDLVVDSDGRRANTAEVFLPDQTVTASVHNVDLERSVATLRLSGGPLPVPNWRTPDRPVELGDPVWLAAVAGPRTGHIAEGTISAVAPEAILTTLPVSRFTAGGALLDREGEVIGVATTDYEPFGPNDGTQRYALPIRQVCAGLMRCPDQDVDGALPAPALPAPGARAQPPDPPPDPQPRSDGDRDAGQPPADDPREPDQPDQEADESRESDEGDEPRGPDEPRERDASDEG